jgi:hypothetical protein
VIEMHGVGTRHARPLLSKAGGSEWRQRAVAAAASWCAGTGTLAAQTRQQVQDAADQAIHRLDLQTEFPRGPEPSTWHLNLPPETYWVVVAVAVAILLYLLRDMIPFLRAGTGAWTQDEMAPGDSRPADETETLVEADKLAAAGRFVEAMHVLLLQGLAHMRHRLDQQFSDSLTSREILHSTDLPEAARAALRDVVGRVELTYFGKRSAGLADYTACRESFHALTQSLYGKAAA